MSRAKYTQWIFECNFFYKFPVDFLCNRCNLLNAIAKINVSSETSLKNVLKILFVVFYQKHTTELNDLLFINRLNVILIRTILSSIGLLLCSLFIVNIGCHHDISSENNQVVWCWLMKCYGWFFLLLFCSADWFKIKVVDFFVCRFLVSCRLLGGSYCRKSYKTLLKTENTAYFLNFHGNENTLYLLPPVNYHRRR